MTIVNNRVLISYAGQPNTCYGFGEPGHQINDCPQRRKAESQRTVTDVNTWVHVVKRGQKGWRIKKRTSGKRPPCHTKMKGKKKKMREAPVTETRIGEHAKNSWL